MFERLQPDDDVVLGEAWAGSSVNCVPFRHEAIVPVVGGAVVSFYDSAGQVVMQRVGRGLELQRRMVIESPVTPHDAHTCISLGLDASGTVHAVFGAHSSIAYHIRVPPLLDVAAPAAMLLEGRSDARITYPAFIRQPRSGLLLLYREGGPWGGEIRLKRWQDATSSFVDDVDPILSGQTCSPTAGPYINRPVIMPDSRIAFFCVWRLARAATTAGDVANVGIDLVLADSDVRALSSLDGIGLARPVTPVHAPRIWAVPAGANLINQASAAVGPNGTPIALTYWNDAVGIPQYHLLSFSQGTWHATPISQFVTKFKLHGAGTLALPHSRPALLVQPDGTALCIFRSSEHGNRLSLTLVGSPYDDHRRRHTVVLLDEDLGYYEPVLDAAAFARDGALVLYVQACCQDHGDSGHRLESAPARLVRWSPRRVAAWQPRQRWWGRPWKMMG